MSMPLSPLWIEALADFDIPIAEASAQRLRALAARRDRVSAREIAAVVVRDPLFALRLMRHLQREYGRARPVEAVTVESAVVMLGVDPFFRAFAHPPLLEHMLVARPRARRALGCLTVVSRSAALHAAYWAALRCDVEVEEIALAALLHETAEMLVWCALPRRAAAVARMQRRDPVIRAQDAERSAFGCTYGELRIELARRWRLPQPLANLLGEDENDPRVRNVALAVRLARHGLAGWQHPALAADYAAIAALLHVGEDEARRLVFESALLDAHDRLAEGFAPVWLPPLPPPRGGAEEGASAAGALARAQASLAQWNRDALGAPPSAPEARWAAALLDAAVSGLGFCAAALYDCHGERCQPLYLSGRAHALAGWRPLRTQWIERALAGEIVAVPEVDMTPGLRAGAQRAWALAGGERYLLAVCGSEGEQVAVLAALASTSSLARPRR
jgi:HD-like signal output (HDOD) protein